MLVDKFLKDSEKKAAICDALGGKMNAVYDYGQRRKEENEKIAIEMIKNNEDEEKIKKYTRLNDQQINELKEKILASN